MKKQVFALVLLAGACAAGRVGAEEAEGAEGAEEVVAGGGEAVAPEQEAGFDALVAQAMEHYRARRYEQAIELFEQAYRIEPEPELVYNIARSHERLLHRDEAVEAYQRFLELPGTTGELRTRALSNLTALRQEIAALAAVQQTQQTQQTQAGAQGQTGTTPAPQREVDQGNDGLGPLGVAGLVLVGGGAVVAVVGVAFWALALSSNTGYQDAGFGEERLELRQELERRALVGDVLTFAGLGVAAVGVALAAVAAARRRAARHAGQTARVSLAPGFSGLGLGLAGAF